MSSRSRSRSRQSALNVWSMSLIGISLLSLAIAAIALMAVFSIFREEFPDPAILKTHYPLVKYQGPKQPPQITLQRARPQYWVNAQSVSPEAIAAIIISEDWAFFSHPGYDANQIKLAIKEDLQEGRFSRGASTITQQMIKNVFLERDKNLWRKIKELVLALHAEKKLGKRKILEVYLNIAEWGEGIYGIGPASNHYFGKPPSLLTAKEGAFLAMLLPSPKKYSQSFRNKKLTPYARETIESILGKMVQAKYITEEERLQAISSRLSFESDPSENE